MRRVGLLGHGRAAEAAFSAVSIDPSEVDFAKVQDTDADAGLIQLDGRLPINTDANGKPVGASGLRQVYEVVTRLRGEAGARQLRRDPNPPQFRRSVSRERA